jgi:hypothetical protein
VLVQVALFIFAMSAMLSLIIDIGYAHITQGQMQSAADSAAIEGIRQRDAVGDPARREVVNTVVGWTFDDNFDPTDGDADYQFGAGPIIDLTEGATSLHGMQMSSVPAQHVYKPNLQANPGNAPEGDMVSGRFCYSADPLPSESVAYEMQDTVCGQPQLGRARTRTTSTPAARTRMFSCACAGPTNTRISRAERTRMWDRADPSLPLTFGKATTIHGDDPGPPTRCGAVDRARDSDCGDASGAAPRSAPARANADRAVRHCGLLCGQCHWRLLHRVR